MPWRSVAVTRRRWRPPRRRSRGRREFSRRVFSTARPSRLGADLADRRVRPHRDARLQARDAALAGDAADADVGGEGGRLHALPVRRRVARVHHVVEGVPEHHLRITVRDRRVAHRLHLGAGREAVRVRGVVLGPGEGLEDEDRPLAVLRGQPPRVLGIAGQRVQVVALPDRVVVGSHVVGRLLEGLELAGEHAVVVRDRHVERRPVRSDRLHLVREGLRLRDVLGGWRELVADVEAPGGGVVPDQAERPLLELRVAGAGTVRAEIAVVGAQVGAVAPGMVVERPDQLDTGRLRLVGVLADLLGTPVPGGVVEDVLESRIGDRLEARPAVIGRRRALLIDALGRQRRARPGGTPQGEHRNASEQGEERRPRTAARQAERSN